MKLSQQNLETMNKYYEHTNTGDFRGAVQYLTDDVIYRIPGNPDIIPYSGDWKGKDRVLQVFDAFNNSFGLVDMTETVTVSGENEIMSFNDEIFVSRTSRQPWRVGVVHHMQFRDGLISSLNNYTDMTPAIQALAGRTAISIPMLPIDPIEGIEQCSDSIAEVVIDEYYSKFPDVGSLLEDQAEALSPGDNRKFRFSGRWKGKAEVLQMLKLFVDSFIIDSSTVTGKLVNNGTVATSLILKGETKATKKPIEMKAVDLFQLNQDGKIGRISSFFDASDLL